MKKSIALFLACGIVLTALLLTGCQMSGNGDEKGQTTRTVVELNENNYWKYFTVNYDMNNLNAGEKGRFIATSKIAVTLDNYSKKWYNMSPEDEKNGQNATQ